jgi:hypothetical protein
MSHLFVIVYLHGPLLWLPEHSDDEWHDGVIGMATVATYYYPAFPVWLPCNLTLDQAVSNYLKQQHVAGNTTSS